MNPEAGVVVAGIFAKRKWVQNLLESLVLDITIVDWTSIKHMRTLALLVLMSGAMLPGYAASKPQSALADSLRLDSMIRKAESMLNAEPEILNPLLNKVYNEAIWLNDSNVMIKLDLIRGVQYARRNVFDSALHVFQKAWEYGYRHADTLMSVRALNNIAGVYNYLGDYNRSLDYNKKAIDLLGHKKDRFSKAKLLLSRGKVQNLNKQSDQAMVSLMEAAEIFKEMHNEVLWLNTVTEMGFASARQDKHEEALSLYRSVLPLYQSRPYDLELIELNQRMADSYMHLKQYDKALPILKQCLSIADSLEFESSKEPVLEMLVEVCAQLGMAEQAVEYSRMLVAYSKDLKERNVKAAVEELEMKHQTRQKALENEVLRAEAMQRELELKNTRYLLLVVLIMLLMVGGSSLAIYRYNRKIKSLNSELELLNADLERAVEIKTAKLEERNKQILETSFSLAHEIRSNVATVLGAIELIKLESNLENVDIELLKAVVESSKSLDFSVKELISRLEE